MVDSTPKRLSSTSFAVDLLACARFLGRETRFRKFANLVSRYFAIVSANVDLAQAHGKLKLMARLQVSSAPSAKNTPQDEDEASTRGALFIAALILYARATQTTSRHRQGLPYQDRYPDHLKLRHHELLRLRNDAVAHYGPGDDLADGYWSQEALSFVMEGEQSTLIHEWSRANYRQNQVRDLIELVDLATGIGAGIALDRERELRLEMDHLAEHHEDFVALTTRHAVARTQRPREGTFSHPAKPR